MSASKKLLDWCKNVTSNYPNCKVLDFTKSWADGVAFLAILHHFDADVVPDIFELKPGANHEQNLKRAFDIAENHFGIDRLLEPEDMKTPEPLSIQTALSVWNKKLYAQRKVQEVAVEDKLYVAAGVGDITAVKEIILQRCKKSKNKQKQFINEYVYEGQSLLQVAAERGHMELIKFLIEAGADVNQAVGDVKLTALHYAALNERDEAAKYLFDHGANPTLQTKFGKTPKDFAKSDTLKTLFDTPMAPPAPPIPVAEESAFATAAKRRKSTMNRKAARLSMIKQVPVMPVYPLEEPAFFTSATSSDTPTIEVSKPVAVETPSNTPREQTPEPKTQQPATTTAPAVAEPKPQKRTNPRPKQPTGEQPQPTSKQPVARPQPNKLPVTATNPPAATGDVVKNTVQKQQPAKYQGFSDARSLFAQPKKTPEPQDKTPATKPKTDNVIPKKVKTDTPKSPRNDTPSTPTPEPTSVKQQQPDVKPQPEQVAPVIQVSEPVKQPEVSPVAPADQQQAEPVAPKKEVGFHKASHSQDQEDLADKVQELEHQVRRFAREQKRVRGQLDEARKKIKELESEKASVLQQLQEVRAQQAVVAATTTTTAVTVSAPAKSSKISYSWDLSPEVEKLSWKVLPVELAGYTLRIVNLEKAHPMYKYVVKMLQDRDISEPKITEEFSIEKIEVIDNEMLTTCFIGEYTSMKLRRRDADTNPKSPYRAEWKVDKKKPRPHVNMTVKMSDQESQHKANTIQQLEKYFEKNPDLGSNVQVAMAWSGAGSPEVAQTIQKSGFATFKKHEGQYGNGIYFTPQSSYAMDHASGMFEDVDNTNPVLVLSYLLVGTSYPITRAADYEQNSKTSTFFAQNFMGGYDTHYVQVSKTGNYPYQAAKFGEAVGYEEIILRNDVQALPRFFVHLKLRD